MFRTFRVPLLGVRGFKIRITSSSFNLSTLFFSETAIVRINLLQYLVSFNSVRDHICNKKKRRSPALRWFNFVNLAYD